MVSLEFLAINYQSSNKTIISKEYGNVYGVFKALNKVQNIFQKLSRTEFSCLSRTENSWGSNIFGINCPLNVNVTSFRQAKDKLELSIVRDNQLEFICFSEKKYVETCHGRKSRTEKNPSWYRNSQQVKKILTIIFFGIMGPDNYHEWELTCFYDLDPHLSSQNLRCTLCLIFWLKIRQFSWSW